MAAAAAHCSGEAKAPPGPFRTTASSLCTRGGDACARIRRYRRGGVRAVFAGARTPWCGQQAATARPTTNRPNYIKSCYCSRRGGGADNNVTPARGRGGAAFGRRRPTVGRPPRRGAPYRPRGPATSQTAECRPSPRGSTLHRRRTDDLGNLRIVSCAAAPAVPIRPSIYEILRVYRGEFRPLPPFSSRETLIAAHNRSGDDDDANPCKSPPCTS